jgi:hypothetical protein
MRQWLMADSLSVMWMPVMDASGDAHHSATLVVK